MKSIFVGVLQPGEEGDDTLAFVASFCAGAPARTPEAYSVQKKGEKLTDCDSRSRNKASVDTTRAMPPLSRRTRALDAADPMPPLPAVRVKDKDDNLVGEDWATLTRVRAT